MLWFGWFGFNAGSALKADGLAAHAFMTSAITAAAAMLSWMLIDVIANKKPTLVGASTGLVVGLVAITPGAGFVPIWSAFIIGALVSPICYFGVKLIKQKIKDRRCIRCIRLPRHRRYLGRYRHRSVCEILDQQRCSVGWSGLRRGAAVSGTAGRYRRYDRNRRSRNTRLRRSGTDLYEAPRRRQG